MTGPVQRFARQIAGHGYIVAAPSTYHEFTGPEPLAYDVPGTDAGNNWKIEKVKLHHSRTPTPFFFFLFFPPFFQIPNYLFSHTHTLSLSTKKPTFKILPCPKPTQAEFPALFFSFFFFFFFSFLFCVVIPPEEIKYLLLLFIYRNWPPMMKMHISPFQPCWV